MDEFKATVVLIGPYLNPYPVLYGVNKSSRIVAELYCDFISTALPAYLKSFYFQMPIVL